jgi:hypothetical protein
MKLINSESPVFKNVSINPVFQIFGDGRRASRSCFIVHICPSPLNKRHHLCIFPLFMTPSPYTSTSWQWILAGQMFFMFKNWITKRTSHLTIGGISDWHGSL